jgi:hypothetical protein
VAHVLPQQQVVQAPRAQEVEDLPEYLSTEKKKQHHLLLKEYISGLTSFIFPFFQRNLRKISFLFIFAKIRQDVRKCENEYFLFNPKQKL